MSKYPRLDWDKRAAIASALVSLAESGDEATDAMYNQMADYVQGLTNTWPEDDGNE